MSETNPHIQWAAFVASDLKIDDLDTEHIVKMLNDLQTPAAAYTLLVHEICKRKGFFA